MACYAPLLINTNDRRRNPGAVVYGTPSYWMQRYFTKSSGTTLLHSTLQTSFSALVVASAISWKNAIDNKNYITIKVVNFGKNYVNLKFLIGVNENSVQGADSKKTVLTSTNVMDDNSFQNPKKVYPSSTLFKLRGKETNILLQPISFTSFDVIQEQQSHILMKEADEEINS